VSVAAAIGLAGAVFYAAVSNHFLGEIISRTVGPYTSTLAEHGFSSPDPEIWQSMAARHEVAILIEPPGTAPLAFDETGRPTSPDALDGSVRGVRTAPDGTRVTFFWTLSALSRAHWPLLGGLAVMVLAVVGSAFWFLQRLLADVSHELRSPIARMKVALELLPTGGKRDALVRDLREMERLIAALLEREELRSRNGRIDGQAMDLAALAREVVEAFAERAPGVRLVVNEAPTIRAEPALVKLVLQNLVDNAVKFSLPDSAPVVVLLDARPGEALLRVADDGIGLPPGQEQRMFEPFVKADRARGHGKGYGIGLSLCRRIVELHGGTISLTAREPRGTVAQVRFRSAGSAGAPDSA